MRRGMRTGQVLFFMRIEPGIPRLRHWKELLATETQATWFMMFKFKWVDLIPKISLKN